MSSEMKEAWLNTCYYDKTASMSSLDISIWVQNYNFCFGLCLLIHYSGIECVCVCACVRACVCVCLHTDMPVCVSYSRTHAYLATQGCQIYMKKNKTVEIYCHTTSAMDPTNPTGSAEIVFYSTQPKKHDLIRSMSSTMPKHTLILEMCLKNGNRWEPRSITRRMLQKLVSKYKGWSCVFIILNLATRMRSRQENSPQYFTFGQQNPSQTLRFIC